jgi:hypothetical protein
VAGGYVVEADAVDAGHLVLDWGAIVVVCLRHLGLLSFSYERVRNCCCIFVTSDELVV